MDLNTTHQKLRQNPPYRLVSPCKNTTQKVKYPTPLPPPYCFPSSHLHISSPPPPSSSFRKSLTSLAQLPLHPHAGLELDAVPRRGEHLNPCPPPLRYAHETRSMSSQRSLSAEPPVILDALVDLRNLSVGTFLSFFLLSTFSWLSL